MNKVSAVERVTPRVARDRQMQGAILIDVRDDDERAVGSPRDSIAIPLAEIGARIETVVANRDSKILALCASGQRSLRAAQTLRELGYTNVASIDGGFTRWIAEELPIQAGLLDANAAARYSRHLVLPEVGVAGQKRLLDARVALIGAGGMGSPSALYLAAAGVGHLTIIDDDKVEKSNLQRQVLHTEDRIGMPKTDSARIALSGLNPTIQIDTRRERLSAANVESLIRDHDIVIDGADNFPTRYLLNAVCFRLKIPLIYGAVHRFTGQASVFDFRRADSPCYRCLFPEPPSAKDAPNCAEAGVLGVLPGIIGLLQANEALKLILDIGQSLVGRLLCFDALDATFRELRLARDPSCPGCGDGASFHGYEDVAQICASD